MNSQLMIPKKFAAKFDLIDEVIDAITEILWEEFSAGGL
jgi:hypothetical protein